MKRQSELSISDRYPSLPNVYENVRNALEDESSIGQQLETKLFLLWSFGTALAGLALTSTIDSVVPTSAWVVFGLIMALWIVMTSIALVVAWPRSYGGIPDPTKLRSHWAHLEPERFMVDYVTFVCQRFPETQQVVKTKRNYFKIYLVLFGVLFSLLLAWSFVMSDGNLPRASTTNGSGAIGSGQSSLSLDSESGGFS